MEKYLIELLETNNRVIVPDLGAFIIRQQEPRELVFNDLLAFNDGMLTSHIKQQEGISMSNAQVKIEEFVDQVKKVLTQGDIYHLENLGYLKMDDTSKIEFSETKFPTVRAEVVSAATLSQYEDLEEPQEQPEKDTMEETPSPAAEEYVNAAHWLSDYVGEGSRSVVVARKPLVFYYFSKLKTVSFPNIYANNTLEYTIVNSNVSYIVLDSMFPESQEYFPDLYFETGVPNNFKLIYKVENPKTLIYYIE